MDEKEYTSLSSKADAAFRQAASKVVQRAKQTDTPVIVWEEGRVKEVPADQIELEEWDPSAIYDRLGVDEHHYTLLGVHIPFIKIPVRPGRNIAAIVEIAARNQLLKLGGHHSAREFQEQLNEEILSQTEPQESVWEQLE